MDCKKLIHLLRTQCLLQADYLLVVGVSGGPDSLCLLDLLYKSGAKVIAVHVNHQLRSSADREADQVRLFCQGRKIQCLIGKLNVAEFAQEKKVSTEEAARFLRYQFLFEKAKEYTAQAVLVAHNADDQAETVLMHILRGSGLSGLRGMQMHSLQPQWSENIPLVRPLLTTSRAEIEAYCLENQLNPSIDESNADVRYFRNRLRHKLLPELGLYNPQIKERLIHLAEVTREEDDFIQQETNTFWCKAVKEQTDQYLLFSRSILQNGHEALLRRTLRKAIQVLLPEQRDIDFSLIIRAADFTRGKINPTHLRLLADLELVKSGQDELILCHTVDPLSNLWPQLPDQKSIPVDLNGLTPLGQSWQIGCSRVSEKPVLPKDPMSCVVNAEQIQKLTVCAMQPGERFTPYNLGGKSIKLGDFWTKQGLPVRARQHWPLVKDQQGSIVWVPGYQISDEYKVTSECHEFLVLWLEKDKSEN